MNKTLGLNMSVSHFYNTVQEEDFVDFAALMM
jgi:hypothetical protein